MNKHMNKHIASHIKSQLNMIAKNDTNCPINASLEHDDLEHDNMEHHLANLADVTLPVVGVHHSPMTQKFGLPRQPNLVDVRSVIELLPPYDVFDAVVGLDNFSHLWLHWYFHANRQATQTEHSQAQFRTKIRPPRLGGNDKVGVFASRSMYRPSQMGMSVVRLQGIETRQGQLLIHVIGADLLDKTPILDIRPYVRYSDAIIDSHDGYADAKPSTCQVHVYQDAKCQFDKIVKDLQTEGLMNDHLLTSLHDADWHIITALIAQDPRPAYRQKVSQREYVMRYKNIDVRFVQRTQGQLEVIGVNKIA